MDVDNMDTTFLKSWSDVLRRTDPLLWSLAFETSSAVPSTSSLSPSTMTTPVHTNGEHNNKITYSLSDPDHRLLLSQAPLLSQSPSTSLQAKESSSKLAPPAHRKHSFCQSFLNPHDAHALDWLKCLILTEDYSVLASEKKGHQVSLSENYRPLGAKRTQDFGPVGQGKRDKKHTHSHTFQLVYRKRPLRGSFHPPPNLPFSVPSSLSFTFCPFCPPHDGRWE